MLERICSDLKIKLKSCNKGKKHHLVWPSSTRFGNLRTVHGIRDIATDIVRYEEDGSEELTRDEMKGITGFSKFLTLPNFNIIDQMPVEYMHSVCIGLIKRLIELTFSVGQSRDRVTKRKLTSPSLFNELISDVQVPREFSRRCRNLNLGVMKAQEFRNLALFFFPIVLNCIPSIHYKEHKLWLLLTYMLRACILPNPEFNVVDTSDILYCSNNFYILFEELFGSKNCSYSVHVVCSHLLKIRGNLPLTDTSAFKFESFYSEVKQLFQPGTTAPLKQIMRNVLMKRSLEFHICKKTIFYKPDKVIKEGQSPGKECNSLIYVFEDNTHIIYKIIECHTEYVLCRLQGRFPAHFHLLPHLNFNDVGIYTIGPTSSSTFMIQKSSISGKVIKVANYLITCPCNVLREI